MTTELQAAALLLSLRPRFAEAILNGTKTVELRRQRVAAPPGTLVILYATAPQMAVVGTARLAHTDIDTPDTLWTRHHTGTHLTRQEFESYLADTPHACALTLTEPRPLPTPLTLAHLRTNQQFQPPQSYRYVTHADPKPLRCLTQPPTPTSTPP